MSGRYLVRVTDAGFSFAPLGDLSDVTSDETPIALRSNVAYTLASALFVAGSELRRLNVPSGVVETLLVGLPDDYTSFVSASPDGSQILVATEVFEANSLLLMSSNGGVTFASTPFVFADGGDRVKLAKVAYTSSAGVLMGAAEHGEYSTVPVISTNGGATWSVNNPDYMSGEVTRMTTFVSSDAFYAAGYGQIYRVGPSDAWVPAGSFFGYPSVFNFAGAPLVLDGDLVAHFLGSSYPSQASYAIAAASNFGEPVPPGAGGTGGVYVSNADGTWGWLEAPGITPGLEYGIVGEGEPIVPAFWTDFTNSYEIP